MRFPDIPEALETTLDFYFDNDRPVPLQSIPKRSHRLVELPASVAAKVILFNELLKQKVRPSELSRRLSIPRQPVNHLLDPRHATKIDNIAAALKALEIRAV